MAWQENELFANIPVAVLEPLEKSARQLTVRAQEWVLREGQPGPGLYYVREGIVNVIKRDGKADVFVDSLGPGNIFGEMSLFTKEPVSASVQAFDATHLLLLPRDTLLAYIASEPEFGIPFLLNVAGELSDRLRNTTSVLTFHLNAIKEAMTQDKIDDLVGTLKRTSL